MVKAIFNFDKKGDLSMDMGDLSDPKYKNPITKDLIKKTWYDLQRALDRNMVLAKDASEDDIELELFIKNSIIVSTSTNAVAQCVNFMIYSQSNGHLDPEDMPTDKYMERVIEHLSMVAQVMMKGHIGDKIKKKKSQN
jgi:hypothetical protein